MSGTIATQRPRALCLLGAVAAWLMFGCQQDPAPPPGPPQVSSSQAASADPSLTPLKIALPKPMFRGTPKNLRLENVEPFSMKLREPFLAPPGTANVALGRKVTGSDKEPLVGSFDLVTDGNKEAAEGGYMEMGPGTQWVQIDLGAVCAIRAIVVWHNHMDANIVHDVIVQVADDEDFIENARALFNNDFDNSSGFGIGKDREYVESFQGKLIDARGDKARYVRLYSRGNTSNDQNLYTEVEVYGTPAP